MTNTKQEWRSRRRLAQRNEGVDIDEGPSQTDNVAAQLESDLQQERDSRREERFYWIFGLVIVVNAPLFSIMPSAWGYWPILVLEVIFLIGLASWLGVDGVKILLQKLYAKLLSM